MSNLIAGPFCGEFGWELFCWQSFVRNVATKNNRLFDKVTVICRPGHEKLYDDYATDFISFTPPLGHSDMHLHTGCFDSSSPYGTKYAYKDIKKNDVLMRPQCIEYTLNKTTIECPMGIGLVKDGKDYVEYHDPKYKMLGHFKKELKTDLIFHARSRTEIRPEDNWSIHKWDELYKKCIKAGYKVSWIGSKAESMCIGENDYRGIPLEELTNRMVSTQLFVSPSSGPIHLAALCNTPHIVWSHTPNKERNLHLWNPFDTRVDFLDKYSWQPPVDYIFDHIKRIVPHEDSVRSSL
jgi:hypothetical protein